jgi:mono/diheme cytochrome c family protein
MTPSRVRLHCTLALATFVVVMTVLALTPLSVVGAQAVPQTGEQLYTAYCAQCHGVKGRGAPPSAVALDLPLPDLSDCHTYTREPDADWVAVIHDGGPARAFDRKMPAFGGVLARREIDAIVTYVRTFCENTSWPRGELNPPRALFTEKAFPEDELVLTTSITGAGGAGKVASKVVFEKRIGSRLQFEAVVPFSHQQAGSGTWFGGIGDLVIGAKHTVAHSRRTGTILSVAGEVIMPTGSVERGFGKGVTIIEPFGSFGQMLPGDAAIQAQVGAELPTDTAKAGKELFWRLAVGKGFTQGMFGRSWVPMVELIAVKELGAGDAAQWDVVPQLHFTLSARQHIMANVGMRFPLNERAGRHRQLAMYLLWD